MKGIHIPLKGTLEVIFSMILALLEMVSLNSDAKNSPDLTTFATGNLIDLIRPSSKMLAQSLTF